MLKSARPGPVAQTLEALWPIHTVETTLDVQGQGFPKVKVKDAQ